MPVSTILLRTRIYNALRVNLAPEDADAIRRAVELARTLPADTRTAVLSLVRSLAARDGIAVAVAVDRNTDELVGVRLCRGTASVAVA